MFPHVLGDVQGAAMCPLECLKGLDGFVQYPDLLDPVQPVVGYVVKLVVVADEIILSLPCRHIIRAYDIFPDRSVGSLSQVQLLVHIVFQIAERNLTLFAYGFVDHLYGIEKLLVIRLVHRRPGNVLYPRSKIYACLALQLFDQVPALVQRHMG